MEQPPLPARADVVVVGAGSAGLCTAFALLQHGVLPTLLDAGAIPPGPTAATWAAAGMLAPSHELEPTELDLLHEGREALALHLQWAQALADAGHDVGLSHHGTFELAVAAQDVPAVQRLHYWQRQQGLDTHWLEGPPLHQQIPGLAPSVPAGIWAPNDLQLDPHAWARALATHLHQAGASLRPHTPVLRVEAVPGGIVLHTPHGQLKAQRVALCTGLGQVEGQPDGPVLTPIRGQMLELEPQAGVQLLPVLRFRSRSLGPGYLVPKANRWLLGSTTEEMGPDARTTAGGLMDVLRKGWAVFPGIYDLPVRNVYAGLRPATPNRKPLLQHQGNLHRLTGLYRHGILLGPLYGSRMAQALLR